MLLITRNTHEHVAEEFGSEEDLDLRQLDKIIKGKVDVKMCEFTRKYKSEIVELKRPSNPSAIVCEK